MRQAKLYPVDGGDMFLRNIWIIPKDIVLKPRINNSYILFTFPNTFPFKKITINMRGQEQILAEYLEL
jgi:hypothetical protein